MLGVFEAMSKIWLGVSEEGAVSSVRTGVLRGRGLALVEGIGDF